MSLYFDSRFLSPRVSSAPLQPPPPSLHPECIFIPFFLFYIQISKLCYSLSLVAISGKTGFTFSSFEGIMLYNRFSNNETFLLLREALEQFFMRKSISPIRAINQSICHKLLCADRTGYETHQLSLWYYTNPYYRRDLLQHTIKKKG